MLMASPSQEYRKLSSSTTLADLPVRIRLNSKRQASGCLTYGDLIFSPRFSPSLPSVLIFQMRTALGSVPITAISPEFSRHKPFTGPSAVYEKTTSRRGRVKGRRPRSIGRFSFLFRGAVLRPGGAAVNSQGRKPLGHAVHAVPRSPGGAAAGGPQAANAWRSGPVGSFRRATGRTTAPPGLRRLALTPTQRLRRWLLTVAPPGHGETHGHQPLGTRMANGDWPSTSSLSPRQPTLLRGVRPLRHLHDRHETPFCRTVASPKLDLVCVAVGYRQSRAVAGELGRAETVSRLDRR